MKKIQKEKMSPRMSPRARKLYLRKLDRECPGFGFYDAYQWYKGKRSANLPSSVDENEEDKLIREKFKIQNPDAIEGYVNSPFRQ